MGRGKVVNMLLENQVVSLELSKKLKELGVKQESYFWWKSFNDFEDKSLCLLDELTKADKISAFTVAELGEMLYSDTKNRLCEYPQPTRINNGKKLVTVWKIPNDEDYANYFKGIWGTTFSSFIFSDTEANARAKMLIYLIENGLLK